MIAILFIAFALLAAHNAKLLSTQIGTFGSCLIICLCLATGVIQAILASVMLWATVELAWIAAMKLISSWLGGKRILVAVSA